MQVAALLPPSFFKEEAMKTDNITDITMNLNDPEWILNHITIALQKSSDSEIVKCPTDLDGIEQYLILQGEQEDTHYSIKVVPVLLSNVCISESTAWKRAMENLCADTQIMSLEKVLSDITGMPFDNTSDHNGKFHVISNSRKCKGAGCIMNRKALRIFAQTYDTNMLFILPSSVHEMMIAPYDSSLDLNELSAMVKEINETQVAPEERLTDRAYILSF